VPGSTHLFLRLAIPAEAKAAQLGCAWRHAVAAVLVLGDTTHPWDSDARRGQLAELARAPALLQAIQGVVANLPAASLDMLAADGGDASVDALMHAATIGQASCTRSGKGELTLYRLLKRRGLQIGSTFRASVQRGRDFRIENRSSGWTMRSVASSRFEITPGIGGVGSPITNDAEASCASGCGVVPRAMRAGGGCKGGSEGNVGSCRYSTRVIGECFRGRDSKAPPAYARNPTSPIPTTSTTTNRKVTERQAARCIPEVTRRDPLAIPRSRCPNVAHGGVSRAHLHPRKETAACILTVVLLPSDE